MSIADGRTETTLFASRHPDRPLIPSEKKASLAPLRSRLSTSARLAPPSYENRLYSIQPGLRDRQGNRLSGRGAAQCPPFRRWRLHQALSPVDRTTDRLCQGVADAFM